MTDAFRTWLVENKHKKNGENLSFSSTDKYARAIKAISLDMANIGIIHGSLYNISSPAELIRIIERIKKNDFFISKNQVGHNMYSVALDHYLDFIRKTAKT